MDKLNVLQRPNNTYVCHGLLWRELASITNYQQQMFPNRDLAIYPIDSNSEQYWQWAESKGVAKYASDYEGLYVIARRKLRKANAEYLAVMRYCQATDKRKGLAEARKILNQ